jgi:bifunctional oligoribonuclease and PAP phosphatase NrnA
MSLDWHRFQEIIDQNQRFTLSGHVRPDADALGSELALEGFLKAQGKSVRIVNPSEIPDNLRFMDPKKRVMKLGQGITGENFINTDVHVILDTSAWKQLLDVGKWLKKSQAVKVVIDHHMSSDDLGAIDFKDSSIEATGSLIFDMAETLGWEFTPEIAKFLFCAITTDTGWFRYPSTRSETMRIASKLMEYGVKPSDLYQHLYERASHARIHLAGKALSRVRVDSGGRLAYTWVLQKDLAETKARLVDTEDLVNDCLKIVNVKAAFIAIEQPNRTVKFSFRAREGVDVASIAEKFNGGGHKLAAGAMLNGPMDQARKKVLETLKDYFSNEYVPDESTKENVI